jgi:cytidylate kinase
VSAVIIAIDGPAASGKGTLARRLAEHFALAYLDTGALYRAVGRDVLAAGCDPADAAAATESARRLDPASLADPRLRDPDVARASSVVAVHPPVRAALLDFQRGFAARPPGGRRGAVLDGRDIGTVVCPQAPLKLYITASGGERAVRRHKELAARGEAPSLEAVLADLQARDARDSSRASAPMKPAADAVLVDTTALDADAVFTRIVPLVEALFTPFALSAARPG